MKPKYPVHTDFYGAKLVITKDVLNPRDETEFLAERADNFLKQRRKEKITKFRVLDMGTGSGAIAVSLAKKFPVEEFTAADISEKALKVAKQNAKLNGLKNIKFVKSNLFKQIAGKFDLIVANLPYVETNKIPNRYEPSVAFDGGERGLDVIEKFLHQAGQFLKLDGAIMLEIGYEQGAHVKLLARKYLPKKNVFVELDYAGHDRYVIILPDGTDKISS